MNKQSLPFSGEKGKTILLVVILIIIIVGIYLVLNNKKGSLVGSGFGKTLSQSTPVPSPTIAPPNAPKTYSFDSQTDLNAELEKINPQVLDSDFEE